jgi:hypothetical protein
MLGVGQVLLVALVRNLSALIGCDIVVTQTVPGRTRLARIASRTLQNGQLHSYRVRFELGILWSSVTCMRRMLSRFSETLRLPTEEADWDRGRQWEVGVL